MDLYSRMNPEEWGSKVDFVRMSEDCIVQKINGSVSHLAFSH